MWFAINVKEGMESQALGLLRQTAEPAGVEDLFVPTARMQAPAMSVQPLIPGCVVAVSPSAKEVRAAIRRARGIEDMLAEGKSATPLSEEEAAFIRTLTTPESREVAFSEGVIERGRVVVKSGPLLGREDIIRRVSHRKRRAYVSAHVAGKPVDLQVGLRVVKAT